MKLFTRIAANSAKSRDASQKEYQKFIKWVEYEKNHTTFILITGIAVGFTIAYIFLTPSAIYNSRLVYRVDCLPSEFDYQYHPKNLHKPTNTELPPKDSHGHQYEHHLDFHNEEDMDNLEGPIGDVGEHNENDTFHRMTDSKLADTLYKEVRILCWVMTGPKNHESKAKHVKATWGKRCNKLIFMSSMADENLPAVALNVSEGRDNLWAKTKNAFQYVYQHHFDDADWFMKADDDTYVILENLRYMLYPVSPDTPIFYGCRLKPFLKQRYMSGGAGYVLSKEALRRFVKEALPDKKLCRQDHGGAEDVEMGKCLANVYVAAGDSRDDEQRGRFFPFSLSHHLTPGLTDKLFWYWNYIFYYETPGMDCCSDNAISFHYIDPGNMYLLEYLIYHLKPFGIGYNPQLPPVSQVLPSLKEVTVKQHIN